ncbi:hypothetical protein EST38_g8123 [Candolleomyces aberdarensis]|uniref:Methyltransferase domain-containing protein n=1 Tax=Candolleomyces aberdarensis TaxID=2316362 RepID=A0A4Q2DFE3_9AGAR|nr:hypothetical protein EST38_g8123 [Candolleomyces aberdarensis]
MLEAYPFDKQSTSVLDFACGAGLMCKELYNYSRAIVGFDISPVVVERCNQVFKELGAGEESYAFVANILTDKDILPGKKFDLVFCSNSYHHFDQPEEVTRILGTFLKPGGTLLIIDNIQSPNEPPVELKEEHRHFVVRYGFTEEDIKRYCDVAGLDFVSYSRVPPDKQDLDLFIAKVTKPLEI